MAEPAYTRLHVDERRRQLLDEGARLFAEHAYADLSMARIAREAGISKALLYHYFPSKQDFFVATLQQGAEEIARRTEPNPDLPAFEALAGSLEGYLGWIEENEAAYRRLMEGAGSVPEVKSLVDGIRDATSARILAGIGAGDAPPPKLRVAARAWLWFMDGAILDWLEHRDMSRAELRDLLLGSLAGSLTAAGWSP
jgi:AcrR family transcriptional regulator